MQLVAIIPWQYYFLYATLASLIIFISIGLIEEGDETSRVKEFLYSIFIINLVLVVLAYLICLKMRNLSLFDKINRNYFIICGSLLLGLFILTTVYAFKNLTNKRVFVGFFLSLYLLFVICVVVALTYGKTTTSLSIRRKSPKKNAKASPRRSPKKNKKVSPRRSPKKAKEKAKVNKRK
jgi:peptidoglycan/LPS O-acetylase OafA/YrhL